MKLLIHAINGIGLGHVIRTGQIAEALQRMRPDVEIIFVTNSKFNGFLKSKYKVYLLKKDTRGVIEGQYTYSDYLRYNEMAIRKIITHESPDVALFDCELNRGLVVFCKGRSLKTVYVLRLPTRERFQRIQGDIGLFDAVIVPHMEDDFPSDQRDILRVHRAYFVGPIVQAIDHPGVDDRRGILITLGSGAKIKDNEPLYMAVDAFLNYLRENRSIINGKKIDVDIVTGPFYDGGCQLDGFPVRAVSESLAADMGKVKVVISAAGYNTINEIIITKTPAVVVPLLRQEDDQFRRAETLGRLGCIRVAELDIHNHIEHILNHWENYHKSFSSIKPGNGQAASVLSGLLDQSI